MKLIEKIDEVKPVAGQPAKYVVELNQDEADFIRDILGSNHYSAFDRINHYFTKTQYMSLYEGMCRTVDRDCIRRK